jgi:dipeptidyl-peptidase 4
MNTYLETRTPMRLDNGDLLWWSERDGWAHLYRYSADGTLLNRLTEGPFSVDGVVGVDEDRGWVFEAGQGREAGEDPYYQPSVPGEPGRLRAHAPQPRRLRPPLQHG